MKTIEQEYLQNCRYELKDDYIRKQKDVIINCIIYLRDENEYLISMKEFYNNCINENIKLLMNDLINNILKRNNKILEELEWEKIKYM